jgi:hypothetical protein
MEIESQRYFLHLLGQHDMGGVWRGNVLSTPITEEGCINIGEEVFATAKQNWDDGEVHFVHEPGFKVLPYGGDATAEPYVLVAGRRFGAFKRGVDAVSHEMKNGTALHRDRLARVMGEHEDIGAIGRIMTPPAFPAVVRPFAPNRAEHVPPHDPGADNFRSRAPQNHRPGRSRLYPFLLP